MSQYIIKLGEDEYIEWSTSADCPASQILTRDEMKERLTHIDIMMINEAAETRLRRADDAGTSLLDERPGQNPVEHIAFNRMGVGERRMKGEDLLAFLRGEKAREDCETLPWDDEEP